MKKIISTFLAVILLASFVSCDAPDEPVVISPKEYVALSDKHLLDLLVGGVLVQGWQNANEIEPDSLMYYYASSLHRSGSKDFADENGYIPADKMEAMLQSRFDVTTEHLRTNTYYNAEQNAYEFGGLGSMGEPIITSAVITGNQLAIEYEIIGFMDYVEARGTLAIEVSDGDIWGDDNKFLSNEFEWSAQHELRFPSSMDEVDNRGVFMMDSHGQSGLSEDGGETYTYYYGDDLGSIVSFYENEALPALGAEGAADTTKYEDGWYWSGTYRGGTPLEIDVQRKFGEDSYVITALHDGSDNANTADNMRRRDFMQPPNLNDSDSIGNYLYSVFSAGVLDTTWDIAENIDATSLVALYAQNLYTEEGEEPETIFAAEDVERYVQRNFDVSADWMRGYNVYDATANTYEYTPAPRTNVVNIVSALSYGREDKDANDSPIRIVIAYEVMPSEDAAEPDWSGELEIELSNSGYKYLSNKKVYSQYPITQDTAYLDELTDKYLWPLMPAYGIAWKSWRTASEIPADDLVNFCAFNNLLNLPKQPDFDESFVNNHAQPEAVEVAVQQYFDVPAEYLRTSLYYNHVTKDGERYDNEYIMLYGFGGGGMTAALNAVEEGDLLKITVGLFGPDDVFPDRPQEYRLLTIKLDGDSYQYISNVAIDRSGNVQ
jgi:hypothetical protein